MPTHEKLGSTETPTKASLRVLARDQPRTVGADPVHPRDWRPVPDARGDYRVRAHHLARRVGDSQLPKEVAPLADQPRTRLQAFALGEA